MKISVFINGILNFPGASRNWTGRAVTWTHTQMFHPAEKVEYFAGPLDRVFGQKERAAKLHATLMFYKDWQITLSGHSNGCDVICDMLRDYKDVPNISRLNLACAACDADFRENGLNERISIGVVDQVNIFIAEKDLALRAAHSIPGRIFGYGTLGLTGPQNVASWAREKVNVIRWPNFGHSDCWEDDALSGTLRQFEL